MTILTDPINTPEAWTDRARTEWKPWAACGWSFDGQMDRFDAVLDELDPQPGERLLDWGCGTGALTDLISPGVTYIGFDWAEGMVDRAKREHPGRRFQTWEPLGDFDLVACVGPFNLPGSKEATWHMLRRLFERTTRKLVASLYAGADDSCLQYTLRECEQFAARESYYSRAEQWRSNDILVVLTKCA